MSMELADLLKNLFGESHCIERTGDFVAGEAVVDGETVAVVGTTAHAPIGVELALRHARVVLDTVRSHPGRTILFLIDTQGQRLKRQEELIGINRAMAHLAMCVDLARREGHHVIGLVYDQALSGGFLATGLAADACYALPEAEIRVMRIPAMARVTKLSEDFLTDLSKNSPVFAPGVSNYMAMGGVKKLWTGDLRSSLARAMKRNGVDDNRALHGKVRGGRTMAADVIDMVMSAA
jgi:malonate decarboxylase gamma subunit